MRENQASQIPFHLSLPNVLVILWESSGTGVIISRTFYIEDIINSLIFLSRIFLIFLYVHTNLVNLERLLNILDIKDPKDFRLSFGWGAISKVDVTMLGRGIQPEIGGQGILKTRTRRQLAIGFSEYSHHFLGEKFTIQNFIDRKTSLCKIASENGMGDERDDSGR